ncbi:MAG: ribonuclease III [Bacteroidia bacterium]|nr:ribonuclease III [Bacteroidia bacterium]
MRFFFSLNKNDKATRAKIRDLIGFRPGNLELYKKAFRHLSASEKIQFTSVKNSNERLEYLGDAVLDMVIAEIVFKKFPFKGEGFLTEVRSKIVSRRQLSSMAIKIGIPSFIEVEDVLSKNRHVMSSLAGNALEALVGAIYLDRGYRATKHFVYKKLIKPHIDLDDIHNLHINYKSLVNQWAQKNKKQLEFKILTDKGNAKNGKFKIALVIDGEEIATAENYSKKNAEKMACSKAAEQLGLTPQN